MHPFFLGSPSRRKERWDRHPSTSKGQLICFTLFEKDVKIITAITRAKWFSLRTPKFQIQADTKWDKWWYSVFLPFYLVWGGALIIKEVFIFCSSCEMAFMFYHKCSLQNWTGRCKLRSFGPSSLQLCFHQWFQVAQNKIHPLNPDPVSWKATTAVPRAQTCHLY